MNNVTKENFFIATIGIWHEIKEVPIEFTLFFESKDSSYYINKRQDTVCRVSGHWGSGIRYCNWYLKGRNNNNSIFFQKMNGFCGTLIGVIKLSEMLDVSSILTK